MYSHGCETLPLKYSCLFLYKWGTFFLSTWPPFCALALARSSISQNIFPRVNVCILIIRQKKTCSAFFFSVTRWFLRFHNAGKMPRGNPTRLPMSFLRKQMKVSAEKWVCAFSFFPLPFSFSREMSGRVIFRKGIFLPAENCVFALMRKRERRRRERQKEREKKKRDRKRERERQKDEE